MANEIDVYKVDEEFSQNSLCDHIDWYGPKYGNMMLYMSSGEYFRNFIALLWIKYSDIFVSRI